MQQAGYSQKPLAVKLGIKVGQCIAILNSPPDYHLTLGELPPAVTIQSTVTPTLPFIHFFTTQRADLEANFPSLRTALTPSGMLWISWPKRAAKISTDLDENIIRDIGLAQGLVDVKVAAIDLVWSGLKFVYRLKDRVKN